MDLDDISYFVYNSNNDMIKEGVTEQNFSMSSHEIYRFPCIGVCSIDLNSGYCLGCSRTLEEIYKWGDDHSMYS